MRTLIIIFLGIGLYFLLRRVDFIFQWIPVHVYGSEGGLIEIGIDTVFGAGATFLALVLGIIHFIRRRQSRFARPLLVWCILQLIGFIGFFIYDMTG